MDAPLLLAVSDEMVGRSWSVLRFNFRGVGRSAGTTSLGEEEVSDVLGAIDWLTHRNEPPVAVAGWSFGASVAIRACAEWGEARGCAAIAPSVEAKEGIIAGVPDPGDMNLSLPVLVVIGDNDEQVSAGACRAFAAGLPHGRFEEIQGANHFFWAKYPPLCAVVGDFLDEVV
jgi:alpha/beta superfamily hydrolase